MNPLSAFGRLSYSGHMLGYPIIFGSLYWGIKAFLKSNAEKSKKAEWDAIIAGKPVDRNIFNPFTPIPYHNNEELKYSHDHIHMFGYLNENQLNVHDYPYKLYHDSYDHDGKKTWTYNWISYKGPNY